jgi:transposase InsO family protein
MATKATKSRRRHERRYLARGRRFTDEDRRRALEMIASGVARATVAEAIGTTTESLRVWTHDAKKRGAMPPPPAGSRARRAEQARVAQAVVADAKATAAPVAKAGTTSTAAPRSPYAPADPAQGLSDVEVAAILEWKKKHPSMGPAQLRAQLKRFHGLRLSVRAIARVLRGHGYAVVHRGARPGLGAPPVRFEAPRRNALWQADFCEVRVGDERLHALLVLDDFSRFIVGHALTDAPSSAVATATFRAAVARHGKPEAVRTDRGGGFVAHTKDGDFARVLEAELVDHLVGRSYSPRGGGKVESAVGTLKRELWECFHFEDRDEAERRLAAFVEEYNHRRAHMGIDGLTPADRFFGRADQVLARVDAQSRRREALTPARPGTVEETLAGAGGAPLEVLRLVLHEGHLELRFCGARVQLGPLMT